MAYHHNAHPPGSKIKKMAFTKAQHSFIQPFFWCFFWQHYSLPCALEGRSWEPADRRPRPAAPVEGATGSQPNRTGSFLAGQRWAPAWAHGAGPPRPHASGLPPVQATAAACTSRTQSPASRRAAGFLSPPLTEPRWTHATWCPWGGTRSVNVYCSHPKLSGSQQPAWLNCFSLSYMVEKGEKTPLMVKKPAKHTS